MVILAIFTNDLLLQTLNGGAALQDSTVEEVASAAHARLEKSPPDPKLEELAGQLVAKLHKVKPQIIEHCSKSSHSVRLPSLLFFTPPLI